MNYRPPYRLMYRPMYRPDYGSEGGIPAGTYSLFQFFQGNLTQAITDRITGEKVLNQSASPKNLEQLNGTVQTFTAGESAFVVGDSMVSEDVSTNLSTNYNFEPADFTNVTQAGTATFTISSAYSSLLAGIEPSNGDCYLIDNSGEVAASSLTFNGGAANTNSHSMSVRVYVISGSAVLRRSSTTAGEVTVSANSAFDRAKFEGFTAAVGDKVMVTAAAGAVVAIIANQIEEAEYCSSEIVVAGSSATRTQDSSTVSIYQNLIRTGMWETPESSTKISTTSDYNAVNWVNGVNDISNSLTFRTGDTISDAKYKGDCVAGMIGAVGTVGTSKVRIASITNTNQIAVDVTAGDINDFAWPAPISWDWSRSSYPAATKEADIIALRTGAGDANTWDSAVKLPGDDFEFVYSTALRSLPSAGESYAIYGVIDTDAIACVFLIAIGDVGDVAVYVDNGVDNITASITPNTPIAVGDLREYTVRLTSGGQLTLTLDDGATDSVTDTWTAPIDYTGLVHYGLELGCAGGPYPNQESRSSYWRPI